MSFIKPSEVRDHHSVDIMENEEEDFLFASLPSTAVEVWATSFIFTILGTAIVGFGFYMREGHGMLDKQEVDINSGAALFIGFTFILFAVGRLLKFYCCCPRNSHKFNEEEPVSFHCQIESETSSQIGDLNELQENNRKNTVQTLNIAVISASGLPSYSDIYYTAKELQKSCQGIDRDIAFKGETYI